MVSFSVATTFILGGAIVGDPWNGIVLTFSVMTFFVDLGEEIASDAMDIDGDKKTNSKSIAIKFGRKVAVNISSIIFVIVIFISGETSKKSYLRRRSFLYKANIPGSIIRITHIFN